MKLISRNTRREAADRARELGLKLREWVYIPWGPGAVRWEKIAGHRATGDDLDGYFSEEEKTSLNW